ncbi:hypothetical protein KHU12_25925, partial [Pseudocitrobacter faecalis]|uniref:hypothetical protein n=1 Tax=Pseudocitrobacter faecalis TaxID=1398493 RepID=UPI003314D13D
TILFERDGQLIEINKAAFSESNLFIKDGVIQKTREDVPFVSVFAGITMKLINESEDFKAWLKKILPAFQINDIYLDEVAPEFPFG